MNDDLPQRVPMHHRNSDVPFRATTLPRAALLIRVAAGLDAWAAHHTPAHGPREWAARPWDDCRVHLEARLPIGGMSPP